MSIADTLTFLKTVTFRKVWNASKVYISYHLSRLSGTPDQKGLPFSVSIEPTTACNLRCPECPSGLRAFTRPTGNLRQDFFRTIIDQNYRELFYLIFYFQGEPYINPQFLDMVSHAHQRNIYTITSTNGHFLDDRNAKATVESGLSRLIISVDGTTQETYEHYRQGGHLDKVLDGARRVVSWKKKLKASTPHIIFQFLVVKPNEHQIEDVHQLAREIGVDEVKLKTAQIYDYENGSPLIPTQSKYSRYAKQADGKYSLKNELTNHCWKLWHSCVITWDGKIVPCCFDKDASHQMGDLRENTLQQIWTSRPYQDFRKELFKGREQIDICTNCTEGCKVWA